MPLLEKFLLIKNKCITIYVNDHMTYVSVIQSSLFRMIIYTHIHFEHRIVFDLQYILQHTFPITHTLYIKKQQGIKSGKIIQTYHQVIAFCSINAHQTQITDVH